VRVLRRDNTVTPDFKHKKGLMMKAQTGIRTLWQSRKADERTPQEAEKLADEAWSAGYRLASHPLVHYQHVMDLVRHTFTK